MRILLYGATGTLGQRVLAEALARGHEVTGVARDPSRLQDAPGLTLRQGNLLDTDSVAALAPGHDVLLSAVGPGHGGDPCFVVEAARSLVAAAQRTGVRLVLVGGAGGPEAAPEVQPVETEDFAATWMGVALAHRDALAVYRAAPEGVDWCYLSPSASVETGERTGRHRGGRNPRVAGDRGRARLSAPDLAAAILDEVERPRHHRQQFTVAY